ncbi:MAG: hypothetical protein PVI44_14765 [Balneolaceae bacterium]|jgi:hypothetical protein
MKHIALLILGLGLLAGTSYAQSPWLSDTRLSSVSLEWDKPLFDSRYLDRDVVTGASSVLFVTGRLRVNDNLRVVGELPLSHFGYEGNNPAGGDDNSTVIGNVYLGTIWDINMSNPNNHAFIELGARIPTTPDPRTNRQFGSQTGRFSELDRQEAFGSDMWSIPLTANFVTSVSDPFALKFRVGTVYNIFVDNLKDVDNQLHLLYGLTAMYRQPTVEGYLGFSGRNQYAGLVSGVDFWDTGLTQLRAGIARPFRNVTPGIYVRKPLGDNYNQVLDLAYGITLEFRR